MVLSVPENVGASLMMASPISQKALKASDSACPEPFETIRFSGVTSSRSKSAYLWQNDLAQGAIALGLAVVQRLSPSSFIIRAVASTRPSYGYVAGSG